MMRRVLIVLVLVMSSCLVRAAASTAEGCPNEQVRSQQGATRLPDCRAWEMVSPLDKNGGYVLGIDQAAAGGIVEASGDGGAITYVSIGSFANPQGAPVGNQYVSRRRPLGWSTENITTPTNAKVYGNVGAGGPYKAFSSDLSRGLLINGDILPIENPPLAPGAPPHYQNFYLRDNASAALEPLLTVTPEESSTAFQLQLGGATSDLSHVVLSTAAALTSGAVVGSGLGENLYEWSGGHLDAVNVPPGVTNGATVPGFLGSRTFSNARSSDRAVSADGSRIYWSTEGNVGDALYVRELGPGVPRTLQVASGEVYFWTASSNGAKAFFTSGGLSVGTGDLYEFDLASDSRTAITAGGSVQGVLGASGDGSHVYFVAQGVLANEANSEGRLPSTGADNLYLYTSSDKHTRFIGSLSPEDNSGSTSTEAGVAHDWSLGLGFRTERVSADGRYVVFMSDAGLTSYDNRDAMSGNPDQEIYLYDAGSEKVSCISCNPSGARPLGGSGIPAGTNFKLENNRTSALYQSRVLSENGERVFFDSVDALVPQDTNGHQDVYEYEHGHASLVSGGVSNTEASFVDADPTGENAFVITGQQLVAQDADQLVDLYDARVGGGMSQVSAPLCSGSGCQGVASAPPIFATPSSVTFNGAGNFPAPVPGPMVKPLTNAQKLARTLKACRAKRDQRKRRVCESQARKRYGPAHRAKRSNRRAGR
jgi:hypothetical protein